MEGKIEKKENYFWGIIGAIIGGLIAAILVVSAYIYTEWMIFLVGTILITAFEFYGYKWCKGKINSKLQIILVVLTIINVLVMTLLFIPLALLIKSDVPISIKAIKSLYINKGILLNILQDCSLSLVFSMLGAYIVTTIIKKKLLLNISNIKLFSSDTKEKQELKEKAISELKPNFEKYNAIQKEKTITKEEVLADLKGNNLSNYFEYLKQLRIIKKYKGKYFYSIESEKNIKTHYSVGKIVGTICLVVSLIVIILISFGNIRENSTRRVYNNDVSFKIDSSWNMFEDYTEENGWIYYKYLNADKVEDSSNRSYPETIGVAYDKRATKDYNSIDDLRTVLEFYINNYLEYDGYNINMFTTSKGYEAIELIMRDETTMEFDYYIYKDGKVAYITAISYTFEEAILDELEEYTKDVVNSFEWNK